MESSYQLLVHTRPGAKREFSLSPENQDRALARPLTPEETGENLPAVLIAVADGVSRCPDGGAVAEWIINTKLKSDPLFLQPGADPGLQLHARLLDLHEEYLEMFRDDFIMRESGCTLAAALLHGPRASIVWSGDSPVYHLKSHPSGFVSLRLTVADKDPYSGALTDCFSGLTPFCLHHRAISLEPGDIIITATDGIVLSGDKLASAISREGFTTSWIDSVCGESFHAPHSDDMAIAAAQWL